MLFSIPNQLETTRNDFLTVWWLKSKILKFPFLNLLQNRPQKALNFNLEPRDPDYIENCWYFLVAYVFTHFWGEFYEKITAEFWEPAS